MSLSSLCTCKNTECPLHPSRYEKGCAPCIAKNLRLQEIPGCFFQKLEGSESRKGDSFQDFAHLVLENAECK